MTEKVTMVVLSSIPLAAKGDSGVLELGIIIGFSDPSEILDVDLLENVTVVAALNLILPSLVCVDVPKQMFLHLIVAEDSLVALLVLVDKSCWRDLTNKS